jgi:HAD superfamily hydrolase (TIGR01549 family)
MLKRPEYEAVIFDFHGTLVEAGKFGFEMAVEAMLSALASHDVRPSAEVFREVYRLELQRYFDEKACLGDEQHNSVWVAAALQALGHELDAESVPVQAAVDAYFDLFVSEMSPLPGALDLLRDLHGRVRVGLLSNFTDSRPVRRVLEREGMDGYFDVVLISAELGRRKPEAEVFHGVLSSLGVRAEVTLFVGDNPIDDIAGAAAVGMKTAYLRGSGVTPLSRMVAGGPVDQQVRADHEMDRLDELRPLLGLDPAER